MYDVSGESPFELFDAFAEDFPVLAARPLAIAASSFELGMLSGIPVRPVNPLEDFAELRFEFSVVPAEDLAVRTLGLSPVRPVECA